MTNLNAPLPFHASHWDAADDLVRVSCFEGQNQTQITLDDTILYHLGMYAEDTLVGVSYGKDDERHWLDIGFSQDNGNYFAKLKTASSLATHNWLVRGPSHRAGLAEVAHKFARCGGEVLNNPNLVRVYLPSSFQAAGTPAPTVKKVVATANDNEQTYDPSVKDLIRNASEVDLVEIFKGARNGLMKIGYTAPGGCKLTKTTEI